MQHGFCIYGSLNTLVAMLQAAGMNVIGSVIVITVGCGWLRHATRLFTASCRLLQVIGTRGDVQPFISVGLVLQRMSGRRVRLATHAPYGSWVEGHGLEFFGLPGDPKRMSQYAVNNGSVSSRGGSYMSLHGGVLATA